MNLVKNVIGLVLFNFFLFTTFSWATSIVGNCDSAMKEGQEYHTIKNRDKKFWNILPDSAITRIFDNLKSFCCNNKNYTVSESICEAESKNLQSVYPETPFLYDHILDILLRRLDAKQKDDVGGDLIYNLEPDDVWYNWRNSINELANNKDWALPMSIELLYEENRTLWSAPYKIWFRDKIWIYSWNLEEINNNYADFNLVNRYYYSCEIALLFYFKLWWTLNIWLDNNKLESMTMAYDNCRILVQRRIDQENSYVKTLLIQKWNTLLQDTIKSYIDSYFIQNRLMNLQDTIFQTSNYFFDVKQNTDRLVQNCS